LKNKEMVIRQMQKDIDAQIYNIEYEVNEENKRAKQVALISKQKKVNIFP
jgi:hypothetical protein